MVQSAPISTSSSMIDVADLRDLVMAATPSGPLCVAKPKPSWPMLRAGVEDHAVAEDAVVVDDDVGVEDAVAADPGRGPT